MNPRLYGPLLVHIHYQLIYTGEVRLISLFTHSLHGPTLSREVPALVVHKCWYLYTSMLSLSLSPPLLIYTLTPFLSPFSYSISCPFHPLFHPDNNIIVSIHSAYFCPCQSIPSCFPARFIRRPLLSLFAFHSLSQSSSSPLSVRRKMKTLDQLNLGYD